MNELPKNSTSQTSAIATAGAAGQPDRKVMQWAAGVLKASGSDSLPKPRSLLLRRLASDKFVPNGELWDVIRLVRRDSTVTASNESLPSFRAAREDELRKRIEDFSERFFQLACAERKKTFDQLSNKAASFPRLAFRLKMLEPGLKVDLPASVGEATANSLVRAAAELFLLHPKDRASRRQELWDEMLPRIKQFQKTARKLARKQPALAALAPDLIKPLAEHYKRLRKARAKWMARPVRRAAPQVSGRRIAKAVGYLLPVVIGLLIGLTWATDPHHATYRPAVNNPARIRAPTFEDLQETERKYGSKAGEAMRRIFHPDQPRADGSVTSNPPDQKMPGLQPPERKSPPSRWNVRPSSAPVTLGKEFEDQLRRGLPDMQPPGVAQPGQPVFPQPQSWQDPSQR